MKFCPQCEKENPSKANHCMYCGKELTSTENLDELDKLRRELNDAMKKNELLESELESQQKEKEDKNTDDSPEIISVPPPPPPAPSKPIIQIQPVPQQKNNKKIVGLIIALTIIILIVFGVFYYSNIYLPAKIDREAPRYYTFAEKSNLRSSQDSKVDFNRIAVLDYGSELITYSYDPRGWSNVKDVSGNKGFISSDLLLNKDDFFILNGIFGDEESKQCISTTRCRLALLNYYKSNGLDSNWKIFCRPKDIKPNNVFFFTQQNNTNSKYDFAVIIKNIQNSQRIIVIFGFNDDGILIWTRDAYAPDKGYIKNISSDYYGEMYVEYSN